MYVLVSFALLLGTAQCANILGVFIYPSYSHQVVYQEIYQELSRRGHQVTVITPNPLNDPTLTNLTEIDVHFVYAFLKEYDFQKIFDKDGSPCISLWKNFQIIDKTVETVLNSTQVKELIWDETKTFDLILIESVVPVMHALGHRFKAPVITISATNPFSFSYDAVGNPNHPILYPEPVLNMSPARLDLWEKTRSVFAFSCTKYYYHYVVVPRAHKMAEEYFGPDVPFIGDLERNVSMFFVARNLVMHPPRPNVPAVIEISPLSPKKAKPLPKNLKKMLDGATEGAIYFSLGTNFKSTSLGKNRIEVILQALSELPYVVFLKWDSDYLIEKPSNVIVKKWFPQRALLAHPKIKVFVTHGGFQSIEEGISFEIPMVGIPFAGDEARNVRRLVELEIGQELDLDSLTKNQLKSAIVKAVDNKHYKDNLREARDILYDRPMTGLENAVWWVEYVIRHKGARHLRSQAIDMHWFEYLLLDVISILVSGVMFCVYLMYLFFRKMTELKRRASEKHKSRKEKEN